MKLISVCYLKIHSGTKVANSEIGQMNTSIGAYFKPAGNRIRRMEKHLAGFSAASVSPGWKTAVRIPLRIGRRNFLPISFSMVSAIVHVNGQCSKIKLLIYELNTNKCSQLFVDLTT